MLRSLVLSGWIQWESLSRIRIDLYIKKLGL